MLYRVDMNFHDKFKVGTKIWAYQFDRCGGKSGRLHNKPPILGMLVGNNEQDISIKNFVPFKVKNGKITEELDIKKSTWIGNLLYADNYKEAIEDYNKLILTEIKFYEDKIDLLKTFIM